MSGRTGAAVALLVLGGALVVVVAVTTPWDPLAALPAGDGAAAGPSPEVTAAAEPARDFTAAAEPARDFTAAQVAREDAFHAAVRPPAYASLLLGLALALVLGLTPLGARLVAALPAPRGGGWAGRVAVGVLALGLLGRLVTLPLDARAEVVLRRYGLSTQTWASWALDQARGLALSTVLLLVVLLGVVALARALPDWWWAPAALGGAALVVALSFAYPLLVEPVFNRFTPLPPGELRTSLLGLAERDGVPVRDVLVADASRRTTAVNAYVSGFGATRRIVVYDTLLAGASAQEVRLITAHELGHVKDRDVLHGTLVGALGLAAGVCVLHLAATSPALLRRAGAAGVGDPRAVALLLALVAVLGAAGGPVRQLVSRRVEARADVHALALTRDPAGFTAMQRRLAVANLSDLDPPLPVYLLFASHPTAPERIALARAWARAAALPEPPPLPG